MARMLTKEHTSNVFVVNLKGFFNYFLFFWYVFLVCVCEEFYLFIYLFIYFFKGEKTLPKNVLSIFK